MIRKNRYNDYYVSFILFDFLFIFDGFFIKPHRKLVLAIQELLVNLIGPFKKSNFWIKKKIKILVLVQEAIVC